MTTIPTLAQLITAVQADLETEYGTSISATGKSFLRALSIVYAGKLKLQYLILGNLQKNIFVDTADPEAQGGTLERFGRVKLNRNPFPAVAGQYEITVTGTVGYPIPALTTFKSNDDSTNPGKLFILDSEFILASSPDVITVRALEAGIESKLFADEELTATIPIPLINRGAVFSAEVVEPLAEETIEDYRENVLDAFRTETQGGAPGDYRIWANDAQGVEKVYPYAASGQTAEVNLYVEATIADSTDGKGTPSGALLLAVEEVIELDPDTTKPINERGRRPLGVFEVNYLPVTPLDVVIDIADFVGVTAAIETLIEDALEQALSNIRPFVAGADVLADRNDRLDTNLIISIILDAVPGSNFGAITLTVDGTPTASYTFEQGDIPSLDSVTYS